MSPKLSTLVANSIVPRMLSSVGVGGSTRARYTMDKLTQIGHLF